MIPTELHEEPYWLADELAAMGAPPQVETAMRYAEERGFDASAGGFAPDRYVSISGLDDDPDRADVADDVRVVLTLAGFTGPHAEWDSLNEHDGPEYWTWTRR